MRRHRPGPWTRGAANSASADGDRDRARDPLRGDGVAIADDDMGDSV